MPGPILELILEGVREDDKSKFREKMRSLEKSLEQERTARGELTRDQLMAAERESASQWNLDYEERKLGPEKEPEKKEEVITDEKEKYNKFLDQLK